ncbi:MULTISPECIES: YbdD/YjiX family protein [Micrococcaceae]|uniref:YbdD/YjiX family protein n=1 Tax=Micrococcaceae TaxID=1268 RepID=UPI00160FDE53|nr:YbdD/YjiX family protein [Citricoccus sp.]MBB5750439.1 uncharacterized short protein YbdD (DUF466 family) [Micrococcus sp. TA1]HRO29708.1 YbdD/YjiX family protein [Citricoccus sp.]HRO93799.1 YbdD/YjiX family protein [Citricoccus sp.]
MAAQALRTLAASLTTAWRSTVWFLRGVLGADAYQHYLAHQARVHPGVEPMSERAFWKDRMDWQDRNPQGRCC